MSQKVLIIDDSEVIRSRLLLLFTEIKGVDVVGQASNAEEGYKLFCSLEPDIIILDIRMPGESGIALLEKIKMASPHTTVVILTNYPHSAYRKRCKESGADFFLDKSTEFAKVEQILDGEHAACTCS